MNLENRIYGVLLTDATAIYVNLRKYATPTDYAVAADWTPATGDVKVSKDGGAAANIGTLPSYVTDKGWKFILSATELTCQQIVVRIADSATKAVCDFAFTVETYGNASAMLPNPDASNPVIVDVVKINGGTAVVTNLEDDYDGTGYAKANSTIGLVDGAITAAKVATGAIDADALATDAVNEIRDAVWAKAMSELAAVPGVTASVLDALQWVFLLSRNKVTQTGTTSTLRNDADNATIATSTVADSGATLTRGEWT